MTKQSFKEDCDINTIMERYTRTGVLPDNTRQSAFGDFVDAPSFQEALDIVRYSNEQFEALPAKVREEFQNDPGRFLAFAEDEANAERLADLGFLDEASVKKIQDAREAKREQELDERLKEREAKKAKAEKTGD